MTGETDLLTKERGTGELYDMICYALAIILGGYYKV